jgi:hypothetical protein
MVSIYPCRFTDLILVITMPLLILGDAILDSASVVSDMAFFYPASSLFMVRFVGFI